VEADFKDSEPVVDQCLYSQVSCFKVILQKKIVTSLMKCLTGANTALLENYFRDLLCPGTIILVFCPKIVHWDYVPSLISSSSVTTQ